MDDVFGEAIRDYLENDESTAMIEVLSPDFDTDHLDPKYLLREYLDWPDLEKAAMQFVEGPVLDVGALAGMHSLYLKDKDVDVTALEIDEVACHHLKKLGLPYIQGDVFDIQPNPYYTCMLLLMNGLGIGGSFERFGKDILHLFKWLKPGGFILGDSSNLSFLDNPEGNEKYYGELQFELKYKAFKTKVFSWLYIDFENAKEKLEQIGLHMEMLAYDEENQHYLAKISRNEDIK